MTRKAGRKIGACESSGCICFFIFYVPDEATGGGVFLAEDEKLLQREIVDMYDAFVG